MDGQPVPSVKRSPDTVCPQLLVDGRDGGFDGRDLSDGERVVDVVQGAFGDLVQLADVAEGAPLAGVAARPAASVEAK
jgi:hypothetical protein